MPKHFKVVLTQWFSTLIQILRKFYVQNTWKNEVKI